jgi:thioredoxin reductase (NADPH)
MWVRIPPRALMPPRPTVKVVGRRLDPEDYRLRDFLTRTAQPHDFYEAGTPQADAVLAEAGANGAALPVVVDGDTVHAGVTVRRLADAWSIHAHPDRKHYDLFIVGAGPAGLAAAVYGASDGLSTAVAEADVPGGQASYTSAIENFFGFVEPIGGAELSRLAGRQAEGFGAELLLLNGVVRGHLSPDEPPRAELASGDEVTSDIVIVAPGMEWRRLELDGVEELLGHGVYYGAGRSEAVQCSGEHVIVVGAGNSAGQAVMNLATAGARVTQVVRGDSLRKSMSAYLVERIEANDLIEVRLHSQVTALHEQGARLGAVTIESADSVPDTVPVSAMFLCIGGVPRTAWAPSSGVQTDRNGFLLTGPDLLQDGRRPDSWALDRDPLALETNIPGVFAAGDVRHGSVKRVAGAVGEGSMAVAFAHHRMEELRRRS